MYKDGAVRASKCWFKKSCITLRQQSQAARQCHGSLQEDERGRQSRYNRRTDDNLPEAHHLE